MRAGPLSLHRRGKLAPDCSRSACVPHYVQLPSPLHVCSWLSPWLMTDPGLYPRPAYMQFANTIVPPVSAPSWAAFQRMSLDSYRAVLDLPQFADTVWNSIVLAVGSATTIMLVSAVIANVAVARELAGWCWSLAILDN